jgi:hypothetical protein
MGVADFPEQPAVFIPNKRPISAEFARKGLLLSLVQDIFGFSS